MTHMYPPPHMTHIQEYTHLLNVVVAEIISDLFFLGLGIIDAYLQDSYKVT
jgi:hypothetical protein